ncbi:MAG: hypothetical protein ACMXYG_06660 [Candidatus Woesearchaeota archaeon]
MKDEILLKISLIVCCIGIISLFFVFQYTEKEVYEVKDLKTLDDNSAVLIYARIDNIRETDRVANIRIMQSVTADALIFKDKPENISLKKGDIIRAEGNMYQGKLVIQKFTVQ